MADTRSTSPDLCPRTTTSSIPTSARPTRPTPTRATTIRQRLFGATALTLSAMLVLTACSSGEETVATPSVSIPATSAMPSAPAATTPAGVAELEPACLTYFELDLFNSDYAAGIVADGGMTEKQAKAEYLRLVQKLMADSKAVEGAGAEGAARIAANAKKMKKIIKKLSKKTTLGEIPAKKAEKLGLQASRIQTACANNGFPLPEVNVQARSDAGIGGA